MHDDDIAHRADDARDAERVESQTCETCLGSGKVATGPWGARPQRMTCPDCNGTKTTATGLCTLVDTYGLRCVKIGAHDYHWNGSITGAGWGA